MWSFSLFFYSVLSYFDDVFIVFKFYNLKFFVDWIDDLKNVKLLLELWNSLVKQSLITLVRLYFGQKSQNPTKVQFLQPFLRLNFKNYLNCFNLKQKIIPRKKQTLSYIVNHRKYSTYVTAEIPDTIHGSLLLDLGCCDCELF